MKRGPYKNKQELYLKARELRSEGYGYRTIANLLEKRVSYNVIRNWVSGIIVDRSKTDALLKKYRILQNEAYSIDNFTTSKGRRNFIICKRGHQCEICKNTEWLGLPIPLELDHIDGNRKNNSLKNLRVICPNCHTMTPTYKGRNIGKGKIWESSPTEEALVLGTSYVMGSNPSSPTTRDKRM